MQKKTHMVHVDYGVPSLSSYVSLHELEHMVVLYFEPCSWYSPTLVWILMISNNKLLHYGVLTPCNLNRTSPYCGISQVGSIEFYEIGNVRYDTVTFLIPSKFFAKS